MAATKRTCLNLVFSFAIHAALLNFMRTRGNIGLYKEPSCAGPSCPALKPVISQFIRVFQMVSQVTGAFRLQLPLTVTLAISSGVLVSVAYLVESDVSIPASPIMQLRSSHMSNIAPLPVPVSI